jgi:hypothetical protein
MLPVLGREPASGAARKKHHRLAIRIANLLVINLVNA